MKGALAIIAMVCLTAIALVKIGTSHVECMAKIKHGYPTGQAKPREKHHK